MGPNKFWSSLPRQVLTMVLAFVCGGLIARLYLLVHPEYAGTTTFIHFGVMTFLYGYGMHLMPIPWTLMKFVSSNVDYVETYRIEVSSDGGFVNVPGITRWVTLTGVAFGLGAGSISGWEGVGVPIGIASAGICAFALILRIQLDFISYMKREASPYLEWDPMGLTSTLFTKFHDWFTFGASASIFACILTAAALPICERIDVDPILFLLGVYVVAIIALSVRGAYVLDEEVGEPTRYLPISLSATMFATTLACIPLFDTGYLWRGLSFGGGSALLYWLLTHMPVPDDRLD